MKFVRQNPPKFSDSLEWKFNELEVKLPVQIYEEPKERRCILLIREDSYDHDYTNDDDMSEEEKGFLKIISVNFDLAQNNWIDWQKENSKATLKSSQGNAWEITGLVAEKINFGCLGDPLKIEVTFAFDECHKLKGDKHDHDS